MNAFPAKISHIHLTAVCGTAMGALAGMLKAKGYRVTGSDQNVYPPMSTQLEKQGIELISGYRPENLQPAPDLVVIGNAMSRGNPEVEYVLANNIPYTSMAACIEELFLTDQKSLVLTGTHGKTTTTSLLAWVLEAAGRDPGFLVGGVPLNFGQGWKVGKGKSFVIEGDEYDTAFFDKESKFLHYRPHLAVITSIEYDHADIFQNVEQIEASFLKFIRLMKPTGKLFVAADEPRALAVAKSSPAPVETYGLTANSDWRASNVRWEEGHAVFDLHHHGRLHGSYRCPLLGQHNLKNTISVIAMADADGLSSDEIASALTRFKGIKRRQEVRGTVGGVVVIDDFAHHPTAVRETLAALREGWPGRRLWVAFEPRTATTRRNVFQQAYAEAFDVADEVLIAGLFAPEKIPSEERFDPEKLAKDIAARGTKARYQADVPAIAATLISEARPGDVIAVFSNGGFGGLHEKLLTGLPNDRR